MKATIVLRVLLLASLLIVLLSFIAIAETIELYWNSMPSDTTLTAYDSTWNEWTASALSGSVADGIHATYPGAHSIFSI